MSRFSQTEIQQILAREGYEEVNNDRHPRTEPAEAKAMRLKLERQAQQSVLAAQFEQIWRHVDGPPLETEYIFHPSRKWLADYAHPKSKTMIELDGGIWMKKGGHQGKGKLRDNEKQNAGNILGWTTFRLSTGQIDIEHVEPIADYIREREDT